MQKIKNYHIGDYETDEKSQQNTECPGDRRRIVEVAAQAKLLQSAAQYHLRFDYRGSNCSISCSVVSAGVKNLWEFHGTHIARWGHCTIGKNRSI